MLPQKSWSLKDKLAGIKNPKDTPKVEIKEEAKIKEEIKIVKKGRSKSKK